MRPGDQADLAGIGPSVMTDFVTNRRKKLYALSLTRERVRVRVACFV
jgi:hypothetical protein